MGRPQPPQMGTAWWPYSGNPHLELAPQTFRQGRRVAETSGMLPRPWLCTGSWEKYWFATYGPYPAARMGLEGPAVNSSRPQGGGLYLYFFSAYSLLPACLDSPLGGPILGLTLAFTKAGAHLPQAMLGDSANGGSPSRLLQPQSLHDSLWLNPSRQPEC